MNTRSAFVLIIAMILMAGPLTLPTPKAGAEEWTPTSDSDFAEGESFFVETSSGSLQLAREISGLWDARGEEAGDEFGFSVASAGDVNGDGYDDVIVGASLNDDGGSNAGEAYLYYRYPSGIPSSPAWSDQGEAAGDNFGYSIASAGDVNGDGYDDVIVGAPNNDGAGSDAGESYLYYGSDSGFSATPDWSDQGEAAGDYFGCSVATAGDVNGDGYDDVIVGAYYNGGSDVGEAYVYYGSSSGLSTKQPDWSDQGEAADDRYGYSVACAGDVNGDGYDDVIVGAHGNDGGGSSIGETYVYYGSNSGLSSSPDWSDQGEASSDYFGYSVSSAGDVNGDGFSDVIVGAYGNDDGPGDDAGEVYVYHGSSSGLSASPDWSDQGEAAGDYFGFSVATAGDVNGDGYDDVIVGANENDGGGSNAGEVYVYRGSLPGLFTTPAWSKQGGGAGDHFGCSVASAGDVNGDGYDDIILGANGTDAGGSNAGRAYVYSYGLDLLSHTKPLYTAEGEAASDYFGGSVAGAGDVNGDGFDDVIVGAAGNDGGGSNAGEAYVYLGSFLGFSNTPDWSVQGEAAEDSFGSRVASAGDVNGDGYDDVIVGASGNDSGGSNAGKAYVYHGSSSGLSATPDWSDQGEAANDHFGIGAASAGDVNGDGYDDVIVGATGNDGGGDDAGEVYVYYGSSSGLSATPDWSDQGEAAGDVLGGNVASAGDVNGDGYDDVLVGTGSNDDAGSNAGKAYVYHGSSSGLSATPGWSDTGEASGDSFGRSVASAGDVNGDGYDDIIVGAPYNDGNEGSYTGEAYIYYGSSSGLSTTPDWSDQGETSSGQFGYRVAGAGDVNGDGFDDVVIGKFSSGVYVYYGLSSGLAAAPDWNHSLGNSIAGAGDVNGDGYDNIITGKTSQRSSGGIATGMVFVYGLANSYYSRGVYESKVFDIGTGNGHPDWHTISWNPDSQPDGTRVRVQVASSNDSVPDNWRGPDGTGTSYYSASGEQPIFSGEQGAFLKLRFYLETGLGKKEMVTRTPTLTDFSICYGTFIRPKVILDWPNGGENLMHGESYPVTWTSTGDLATTDPIALSYSLDGGSTWTSITTGTDNDGLYVWTLPSNKNIEQAMIKVTATAPDGSCREDTSDRPFSIDPPPGNFGTGNRVLSPAAAEELARGCTVELQWELDDEEAVSLHYSTDFGQSWEPIVMNITNQGSHHWKLPGTMTSEHVVIRVQGSEQEVMSDLFIIKEEETGGQEGSASPGSSGNPAVLNGLLALFVMVLVALVLVLRHKPAGNKDARQPRTPPTRSREVKK